MKLRRWPKRLIATAAATAVAAVAFLIAAPTPGFAQGGYTSTATSADGGWGQAIWLNDSSSDRRLRACDKGTPDGLRAVATLVVDGVVHTTHAAGGTETCNIRTISGLRAGASYQLYACLRNGANGSNVYCSGKYNGIVW